MKKIPSTPRGNTYSWTSWRRSSPLRQYIYPDFVTKVITAPQGNTHDWTSWWISLPSIMLIHIVGLHDDDPCRPLWKYTKLGFMMKILSTPPYNTHSWASWKRSLPLLMEIHLVRIHDKDTYFPSVEIHIDGLHDEDPYRTSRQYTYSGFMTLILTAPRGNTHGWASWRRSLSLLKIIHIVGHSLEDPFRPMGIC